MSYTYRDLIGNVEEEIPQDGSLHQFVGGEIDVVASFVRSGKEQTLHISYVPQPSVRIVIWNEARKSIVPEQTVIRGHPESAEWVGSGTIVVTPKDCPCAVLLGVGEWREEMVTVGKVTYQL